MKQPDHLRLNVGSGPHYAEGWWNIDPVDSDEHGIHPDQVIDPDRPFSGFVNVEQINLGHVLEHLPWHQVPRFLTEARETMVSGGQLLVVGPDVVRAIKRWKEGLEPWWLVESCLEHAGSFDEYEPLRHHWNCDEARVVWALKESGWSDIQPTPIASSKLNDWPVPSRALWQFAIFAQA